MERKKKILNVFVSCVILLLASCESSEHIDIVSVPEYDPLLYKNWYSLGVSTVGDLSNDQDMLSDGHTLIYDVGQITFSKDFCVNGKNQTAKWEYADNGNLILIKYNDYEFRFRFEISSFWYSHQEGADSHSLKLTWVDNKDTSKKKIEWQYSTY